MTRRNFFCSILFALLPLCANGQEPNKLAYQVICNDPVAATRISTALESELKAAGLELGKRFPRAKLMVYAQQDLGDTVNTDGWSFAIVHVTNAPTFVVAAKILPMTGPEIDAVKPTLIGMVKEEGFVTYMNVAHVDHLSDENVTTVTKRIVDAFAQRVQR